MARNGQHETQPGQLERQLLRQYEAEAARLLEDQKRIDSRMAAIRQAVSGLRMMLDDLGIDWKGSESPSLADASPTEKAPRPADLAVNLASVIDLGVSVLTKGRVPMGAKEIHRELSADGYEVNYYTLVKNLNREADKPNGRIVKSELDKKYTLRSTITPLTKASFVSKEEEA